MSHRQFTRESRVALATLLSAGKKRAFCARQLGFEKTSINREIKRNKDPDGIYRGGSADDRAMKRRLDSRVGQRKIENNPELKKHIIGKLKIFWSPEQIAGRLRREKKQTIICMETIYKYIYEVKPELEKHLRHRGNKQRHKRGTAARRRLCEAMKIRPIGERPAIVEARTEFGHWEGDTVVGKEKTQRILTNVERMSGFGLADKLDKVTAVLVQEKTQQRFSRLPKCAKRTLTRDNGPEFGDLDKDTERLTGMKLFRATAYHSWERGTNENWNGLARQFCPKGMYFATITQAWLDQIVRLINDRPRKRLGYRTPREVFRESCNSV